jgi:hypothetical protein
MTLHSPTHSLAGRVQAIRLAGARRVPPCRPTPDHDALGRPRRIDPPHALPRAQDGPVVRRGTVGDDGWRSGPHGAVVAWAMGRGEE